MKHDNTSQNKFQVDILLQKLEEYQSKEQNCLRSLESIKIEHTLILSSLNSIKNQIREINPSFEIAGENKNYITEEKDSLVVDVITEYGKDGLTMPEVKNLLDKDNRRVDNKLMTIDELTGCRKRLVEAGRIIVHPSCANKKRFVKYIINKKYKEVV